jgi:hypothetical protein
MPVGPASRRPTGGTGVSPANRWDPRLAGQPVGPASRRSTGGTGVSPVKALVTVEGLPARHRSRHSQKTGETPVPPTLTAESG